MGGKVYESEAWLRMMYLRQRKTPEEIAKIAGVSHMTIYRWINHYNLKR